MLFHSVTEEDVERRNCLAKSCPYCVRNSLLEDQNHSIVSRIRLLTNTPFVHCTISSFTYIVATKTTARKYSPRTL